MSIRSKTSSPGRLTPRHSSAAGQQQHQHQHGTTASSVPPPLLSSSTPNLSFFRGYHPKHDCGVTQPEKFSFKAAPMPHYPHDPAFGGSLNRKKSHSTTMTSQRDTRSSDGGGQPDWMNDADWASLHNRPFYPPGPQHWAELGSLQRIQDARRFYSKPENRKKMMDQSAEPPKMSNLHRQLSLQLKNTKSTSKSPSRVKDVKTNAAIGNVSSAKGTVQSVKASTKTVNGEKKEVKRSRLPTAKKATQTEITLLDMEKMFQRVPVADVKREDEDKDPGGKPKVLTGQQPYSELVVTRFAQGQNNTNSRNGSAGSQKQEDPKSKKNTSKDSDKPALMQADSLDEPFVVKTTNTKPARGFGRHVFMNVPNDSSLSHELDAVDSSAAEAESLDKYSSVDESLMFNENRDAINHSPTVFEDSLDILLNDTAAATKRRLRELSSASSRHTTDGGMDLPKEDSNSGISTDQDNISYWLHKSIFYQENPIFRPNGNAAAPGDENATLRRSAVEISTSKEYRNTSEKADVVVSSVFYPVRKDYDLHLTDFQNTKTLPTNGQIEPGTGVYIEETHSRVGIVHPNWSQFNNKEQIQMDINGQNNPPDSSEANSNSSSYAALPQSGRGGNSGSGGGGMIYPSKIYVTTGTAFNMLQQGLSANPQLGLQSSRNGTANETNEEKNKIVGIKSRFEGDGVSDPGSDDSAKTKRPARVYYAGLQSAKTKFIEEANKAQQQPLRSDKPRRITPPREGVNAGVLESQPQVRDPNIVCYGEDLEKDMELAKNAPTKSMLAKFKDLEAGKVNDEDKVSSNRVLEDFDPSTTKSTMAKWKHFETHQDAANDSEPKKFRLTPEEGQGGVFENEPAIREDVVRESGHSTDLDSIAVNTKELRSQFLRRVSDTNSNHVTKLDPLAEIQLLSQREKTTIYENAPKDRLDGVISADQALDDAPLVSSCNAKELRERFTNPQGSIEVKKKPIQLVEGDGGIFENVPVRLDNVVRWEDHPELSEEELNAKWASHAKQKFMEEAMKTTLPKDKKNENGTDTAAGGMDANAQAGGRYASDAKKRILEMQKAAEEKEQQRKTPGIINIWDELCEYSGVFENNPTERPKDIVSAYDELNGEELAQWQATSLNT